jgi:hypothetical protein
MADEPKKDEALKADESVIEEESPTSEESEEVIETPEESPTETEGEKTESTEEVEVSPKEEGRKTAQSRIRDLVAEKKAVEAKAESLAEQVQKLTQINTQPYVPQPTEETELTVEEVLRRADALTQIRLAQQQNVMRVNNEALEAIKAYPELDPESDNFDSELSESISQATLAKINFEPATPLRKFVDSLMRPYRRSLDKQASDQKETITKQVSEQAMRPTQVQEQEKPFSELTKAEMEQKLGVVYR